MVKEKYIIKSVFSGPVFLDCDPHKCSLAVFSYKRQKRLPELDHIAYDDKSRAKKKIFNH